MNRLHLAAALGLAVLILFAALAIFALHKPEDPGPVLAPVSSEPSAPSIGTVDLLPVADASDESDGSDADAKPTGSGSYDPSKMKACCTALQANAASMPSPQNVYATAAAQYCLASVASINSPGQKDQVIAGIRNMLKGSSLPANCH